MTLYEQYDRSIPEYYDTMYLDGYRPDQIIHAAKRKILRQYYARKAEECSKKDAEAQIKKTIDSAMKDLFKDWK